MKALVTGATGFVGAAVVRKLLERGCEVRAMVRSSSNHENLKELDVTPVTGDLRDEESLVRAVDGCDALFHVAADYRLWVPDPKSMYDVNIEGTRRIMRAALRAGVSRVVYTSSVATLGLRADRRPSDEEQPSELSDMIGHYKRSKFMAEEVVKEMCREEGLPATIVCPSTPVGPGDVRPTPTGRVIVDALAGRMPAYVDTGLNIVHVGDVAQGHLLAMDRGGKGERYILGGENLTLRRIFGELSEIAGCKAPKVRLPHAAIYPVALVSQCWARVTNGGEPRVTLDGVRMSRKLMFFTSQKARQELGYQPRAARAALEDAASWFKDKGYVP